MAYSESGGSTLVDPSLLGFAILQMPSMANINYMQAENGLAAGHPHDLDDSEKDIPLGECSV